MLDEIFSEDGGKDGLSEYEDSRIDWTQINYDEKGNLIYID
jgi:hypothetical protein